MKKVRLGLLITSILSSASAIAATEIGIGDVQKEYVNQGNWDFYTLEAKTTTSMTVKLEGLSDDLDMYVKIGSSPGFSSWDCRPYKGGTSSETCTMSVSAGDNIQIGVYGYRSSGYELAGMPQGFYRTLTENGVYGYRKNYSGGQPDFVNVVQLDKGAKLHFNLGDIVDPNDGLGVYGYGNPTITKEPLSSSWAAYSANESNATCITNGQFFNTDIQPTELAFPIRLDSYRIDGYGINEFYDDKKLLQLYSGYAKFSDFDGSGQYMYKNAIVGLSEFANKNPNDYTGRTFVGVLDRDGNGNLETVLLFNSALTRQSDAAQVLRDFGAEHVMMLDGGGSTQLICNGTTLINSSRPLPQTIGISHGN